MDVRTGDRGRLTRRRLAGGALLGLLIIGGPACQPEPSRDALQWAEIALPDGSDPRSLAPLGTTVVVGGQRDDASAPQLLQVTADGTASPIELRPKSPYAKTAELRSVATEGSRIVALGGRSGGAHGNVRWTVWSGTANGVVEQPQNFYAFGGQDAGGLADIVLTPRGALLLGSWTGATGTDAAVWTTLGSRWTRQPSTGTALASSPDRIVGANAVAAAGHRVVIAGSVTRIDSGVRQMAHAWRAPTVDGPWTSVDLPGKANRSDAMRIACGAGQCWLTGYADDLLALWSLTDQHAVEVDVPATRIDPARSAPIPIMVGNRPGICYLQGDRSMVLLPGSGDQWNHWEGPAGTPIDALITGNRLMMITRQDSSGARLWSATLPG